MNTLSLPIGGAVFALGIVMVNKAGMREQRGDSWVLVYGGGVFVTAFGAAIMSFSI